MGRYQGDIPELTSIDLNDEEVKERVLDLLNDIVEAKSGTKIIIGDIKLILQRSSPQLLDFKMSEILSALNIYKNEDRDAANQKNEKVDLEDNTAKEKIIALLEGIVHWNEDRNRFNGWRVSAGKDQDVLNLISIRRDAGLTEDADSIIHLIQSELKLLNCTIKDVLQACRINYETDRNGTDDRETGPER